MHIGKVIGNIVCSSIYPGFESEKLLLVQPLDHNLEKNGKPLIAVDAVRAGESDLVDYTLGSEGARAIGRLDLPIDACITGIIDRIDKE